MRCVAIFAGLLAGWALLIAPVALAGGVCMLEGVSASEPAPHVQAATPGEVVVVVPESEQADSKVEISVTGSASQSVRVEAPSNVRATAIGGAGAAGMPGASGEERTNRTTDGLR